MIGIDTPEIAHEERPAACYGDVAATYVRDALLGQRVRITTGPESHDKYGRTLADVTALTGPLAGADLAATLADRGLARQLAIPPNDGNAADIERRVRRRAAPASGCGRRAPSRPRSRARLNARQPGGGLRRKEPPAPGWALAAGGCQAVTLAPSIMCATRHPRSCAAHHITPAQRKERRE